MNLKPAKPLKGRGYARVLVDEVVFKEMEQNHPFHVATIYERKPINRFGKLGFVPTYYISPELNETLRTTNNGIRHNNSN